MSRPPPERDGTLDRLVEEAGADPDTVGLVLTGSRAAGTADDASDYDVVWLVAETAFDALVEARGHQQKCRDVERIFQTRPRLERLLVGEHWARASFIGARVLFDRDGDLEYLVARLVTYPPEQAARIAFDAYDGYLNGFVRSLRAWQKGDELGARLHASESLTYLVKALFALERRVAPYHDRLRHAALQPIAAQGWPPDELRSTLREITRSASPVRQQDLQARVEALMESRRVRAHAEWGEGLERLKRASF